MTGFIADAFFLPFLLRSVWTHDKTRNTVEGYDRDVMAFFYGKDIKSYESSTRTTHDKKIERYRRYLSIKEMMAEMDENK